MKIVPAILAASLLGTLFSSGVGLESQEFTAKDGTIVKYRWRGPAKIEPGKTYPLVLFLHGSGERGDDNTAQLRHGVHAIISGAEKLNQPVFLIAPQCPKDRWWTPVDMEKKRLSAAGQPNPLLEAVLALVDETTATQPVDSKRFYITGISMGGYATWDLLGRIPDRIAAAVPICGGGDPSQAANFKEVPIWAFHGEADPAVPVKSTREMISALEAAGGKPKATYYPGVEHDSWTRTYDDPEVIRWIFDQHR
jgi:predicted peptidase